MLRVVGEPDAMELEDKVRKRLFAAHLVYGTPLVRAMRLAGFESPDRPKAGLLSIDPFVREEIDRLMSSQGINPLHSREAIAAQLDVMIEQAYSLEEPGAAISGIVAKAKILGLLSDADRTKLPSKVTIEWGDESKETIYEKSNPLLLEAAATVVTPA